MKPLTAILALLLGCLAAVAMGADLAPPVAGGVEVPRESKGQAWHTGWYQAHPIRTNVEMRYGKTLADIESHMPAGHIYRHEEIGTWAHETVHGINSRLRMELGGGFAAFYVLDNRAFVIREPKCKLADVAQRVPAELRGDRFNLYLIQAQSPPAAGMAGWNDNPTYVLDEWVAYIAGCKTEQELYGNAHQTPSGYLIGGNVNAAIQFCAYASALMKAVHELDPQYPDKDKLAAFIAFNIDRSMELTKLHPQPAASQIAAVYFQGNYRSGCAWEWSGNGWQCAAPRVVSQPVRQQPTNPAPLQPVPPKPVKGCNCDNSALLVRINELEAKLVRLEGKAGVPGPPGPTGPTGQAGASPKIEDIVAEVVKQIPPCEPCKCNSEDEPATRPGKPALIFDIRPRVRN